MEPKVNYTLVGLFIALLGAGIAGGVLWLSQTDYRGVYDRYYTYMDESVSGLSNDSSVKYRGVDVGRVKDIDSQSGQSRASAYGARYRARHADQGRHSRRAGNPRADRNNHGQFNRRQSRAAPLT